MKSDLLIAVIVDPDGWSQETPEQEVESHKERWSKELRPAKCTFYRAWHPGSGDKGIQPGTDMVIYDFGGMGDASLMESNGRAIVNFAQDNPNALVMVVSTFTYNNFIENELRSLGLDELYNVVCDNRWTEGGPVPAWFRA